MLKPIPRLIDNTAPDGRTFSWGAIVRIHEIGDFQVVEYLQDVSNLFPPAPERHGKPAFHAYIRGEDMSRSADSLEKALVEAIAIKFDGANTHAADYFFRIVGTVPHSDYAPKASAAQTPTGEAA